MKSNYQRGKVKWPKLDLRQDICLHRAQTLFQSWSIHIVCCYGLKYRYSFNKATIINLTNNYRILSENLMYCIHIEVNKL